MFVTILIFFSFMNPVQASLFLDDDDKKSEIEETIDKDDGGLFEKIIAKMIRRNSRNCIWFNYKWNFWSSDLKTMMN